MLYDPWDRSFPAVIYNPSAFISRSTFAMFHEMESADLAAIKGTFVDATPLTRNWYGALEQLQRMVKSRPADSCLSRLEESKVILDCLAAERQLMGLPPSARSRIDARSGRRIYHDGRVFSGICTMQKLRQMAIDKMRARGTGPISYATKQPVDSKGAHGNGEVGQKVGGMEGNALLGYGAAMVLYDRMLKSSDPTDLYLCRQCHQAVIHVKKLNLNFCLFCEEADTARSVLGSATFSLFQAELMSMGLSLRLHTEAVEGG
jgi:DNA-directed RNA polymerase beta subunit